MICGHCKTGSVSVDHVRKCASSKTASTAPQFVSADFRPMALADYKPAAKPQAPKISDFQVPASKYALSLGGKLRFFQVNKPTKGKWAGYTFVTELIGAPGDWRQLKLNKVFTTEVLAHIALDPKEAAVRYSNEFTRCAVCESPLSDEESRARGLGPVCAGRF